MRFHGFPSLRNMAIRGTFLLTALCSGLLATRAANDSGSLQVVRLPGLSGPVRIHWGVPAQGLIPPKTAPDPEAQLAGQAKSGDEWDCDAIVLRGSIQKGGEKVDQFRFDYYPGNPAFKKDPVWLVFERDLEPGGYTLTLELFNCEGASTRKVVRSITAPPPHMNPQPAAPELANYPMSTHSVRILPPGDHLMVNTARVEAVVLGEGVDRVRFLLDGVEAAVTREPPHRVALDLEGPRMRTLRVEAVDRNGYLLARDRLRLNQGPYNFSIRLLEPVEGRRYLGSVTARAVVTVPLDRRLEKVSFMLGDQPAATLYNEPFTAAIPIPAGEGPVLLTAVARLDTGREVVDTALFNNTGIVESMRVREVELLVGVTDHQDKPVEHLKQEDFKVFEDGRLQDIQHFEVARNLPVNLVFLTDVSRSMFVSLPPILSGSKRMIHDFIDHDDRASIMIFQNRPRMLIPFTANTKDLITGLQRTYAEAASSEILGSGVYDSIAQALHYFGGIQGRRALVVFTDGEDNRSTYAVEDTLNFARQAEVRIYIIRQKRPWEDEEEDEEIDVLRVLARDSGGAFFQTESDDQLYASLRTIASELRTQYLLRYQSSQGGPTGDCLPIKVKLKDPTLKARTMGFVCP